MVPCEAFCEAGRCLPTVPSYGWQAIFTTMKYVYLLKSLSSPQQRYIGSTTDLQARLQQHNQGRVRHTAKYPLWEVHVAIRFKDDRRAEEFERYLKSGSGQAFTNRRLW
jgi:putative endonuclease